MKFDDIILSWQLLRDLVMRLIYRSIVSVFAASAFALPVAPADELAVSRGRLLSDQAQAGLICNVTIAASVPGEVATVDVSEGDAVNDGDRLALLDDELAQAEYLAAEKAFEAAELQANNDVDARFAIRTLDVRQREYQQSEAANKTYRGTVSDTELDRLHLVVDQARLGIEQALHEQKVSAAQAGEKQAAVDAASVRFRKHAMIAPRAAVVAEVFVQPGQRVDAGEPIARLIDLKTLKVECLVDADQASQIAVGEPIGFHHSSNLVCKGQIDFVSPEVHPVTGQVRILATVDNEDGKLRPGTRGRLFAAKARQ